MQLQLRTRLSVAALATVFLTSGCDPTGKEPARPVQAPVTADPTPVVEPAVEKPVAAVAQSGLSPAVKSVVSDVAGEFTITYEWSLTKKREQDWRIFVHFTDPAGKIIFQNDHEAKPATSQWEPGKVQQGPYDVKIPADASGTYEIRMGLFQSSEDALGASGRVELDGQDDGEKRYLVGHLTITDGKAEFIPIDQVLSGTKTRPANPSR